jgi:hypothetical protein
MARVVAEAGVVVAVAAAVWEASGGMRTVKMRSTTMLKGRVRLGRVHLESMELMPELMKTLI